MVTRRALAPARADGAGLARKDADGRTVLAGRTGNFDDNVCPRTPTADHCASDPANTEGRIDLRQWIAWLRSQTYNEIL